MTRRGLLTAVAACTATVFCLALIPMGASAFASLVIWAGAVAIAVLLAGAIDTALYRRECRLMRSWKREMGDWL